MTNRRVLPPSNREASSDSVSDSQHTGHGRHSSRSSWWMGLVAVWGILAILVAGKRFDRAEIRVDRGPPQPPVTIDLNSDPWPRLLLIEGIGEKLAQRIVAARHERGGFQSLEEVKELPGIPDRVIDAARDWLTLGPTSQ